MAYKLLKIAPIGSSKKDIVASAPIGTETIAASVAVGQVAIILEDTVALSKMEIINALDQLRDQFMENNK